MPAWLPRVLPFALYIVLLACAPVGRDALAGLGVDSRYWYWLTAGLTAVALAWALPRCPEAHARPSAAQLVVALVVGLAVLVLWLVLRADWMLIGTPEASFVPMDGDAIAWHHAVVRVVGMATVVPLMEELFWRSFVQRRLDAPDFVALDPARVSWFALAATSVAFALEHREWLAGVLAGLAYGGLYRHQRVLAGALVAHAVTNLGLGVWIVATRNWVLW